MRAKVLDRLAATPEILRLLLEGVTEDQTRWKASAEAWSIGEILELMSHVEGQRFRTVLEEGEGEPYDEAALHGAGTYSYREAEESFAHWEEQREDNVGYLAELLTKPESRTATALLNEWAAHDLDCIGRIAQLVRSCLYNPTA